MTDGTRSLARGPRRMGVSLRAKLSAAFLAVTLACAAIAGFLVDRNVSRTTLATVEDRLSYETTMLAQMTAAALFGEVDPTDTSLNESVRALGLAVHTELSVIANDGTVVASSQEGDTRWLASQGAAPEIVTARATGSGTAIRDERMYVARAIVRDGRTLGFARSSVPMSEVTSYVLGVRARMAWGSAIALVVAAILGFVFSSRVVLPIRALSEGARRVGAGDFDHTIDVRTEDEIGELAASFNDMTGSLRRTVAMLDGRNRDMRIVLDNVTQGLLTVDRSCVISKERSAIVEAWFGPAAEGVRFPDYIRPGDPHAADAFELQWEQVHDAMLPLELILDQLPKRFVRGEQLFEASYTPILADGESEKLEALLIVLTDVTARVAAERAEAEQREVAGVLERAARDKAGVLEFLVTSESQVRELTGANARTGLEAKRLLHTLKGNCAIFGMKRISGLCHRIEARMQEDGGDLTREDGTALQSAWSSVADRLAALLGDTSQVVIDDEEYRTVLRAIADGTSRAEMTRMVEEWRLERVRDRLQRSAEQARDLARRLEKGALEVEVSSDGLRSPRDDWSGFWAAFVHLVRNAVDHGIELPEERRLAGKPEAGRIRLTARRDGRWMLIAVADDGRGIDWSEIAARAEGLGLPARGREDLVAALFVDGLTSTKVATDISGRGVGLGALQEACRALGGRITVESEAGHGTTFQCEIPEATSVPDRAGLAESIPPRRAPGPV